MRSPPSGATRCAAPRFCRSTRSASRADAERPAERARVRRLALALVPVQDRSRPGAGRELADVLARAGPEADLAEGFDPLELVLGEPLVEPGTGQHEDAGQAGLEVRHEDRKS